MKEEKEKKDTLPEVQNPSPTKLTTPDSGLAGVNPIPQATPAQTDNPELASILQPIETASKSFAEIVDGAIAQRNEYLAQTKQVNKQNEQVQFYGGLAETASALVNLFGTTKGATSQKWQTPLQTWAQRADVIRREREAKLQNYDKQILSLKQAQNQLDAKRSQIRSEYNKEQNLTQRNDARVNSYIQKAIIDAEAKAKLSLKGDVQKTRDNIAKSAVSLTSMYVREQAKMGNILSEEQISNLSQQFYNTALNLYQQQHPSDFENIWE